MKGWFLIMSFLFPCVGYSSTEPFSLADICKAALSTYYGRPLEIMKPEQSEDDFARVKYTRTQDGKLFDYSCMLDGNVVLTKDNSLSVARWYGEVGSTDTIQFFIKNNILTIRNVFGTNVKEKSFNQSDFTDEKSEKPSVVKELEDYAKKISGEVPEKHFKYKEIVQTTKNPDSYVLNFESDKAFITQGVATYEKNTENAAKWKDTFCKEELLRIKASAQLMMITGVIYNKGGEKKAFAPCF
ncbi:TPA: hypothetical protein P2Q98_004205 [Aeromonas veronii]|uniref:hypothetical protein n=1 Tax=Aeromonas veronii TaxID=654 RepID=UPI003308E10F|nr:hypothetical protein [Aeromonas veronii]HDO1335957.1 hypothetical protein [Aeromonas veronii]HDO1340417.1 hypothetical protein [Aeromonas veronii]HDO1344948.1 hypothetical protein [Aeromonas veronii]HDO1349511.1 hypothetical protein [Aeromonas veronii]